MKFTIINLKTLASLLFVAGTVGALSAYVLSISGTAVGAAVGAAFVFVGFALGMFFVGTRVQGHLDDRVIRHYWLTEGCSNEAANRKVVEFNHRAVEGVRSGTFFKSRST